MSSKSLFPALGVEKEYGEKIDRCISDTIIKLAAGSAVGGVFSLLLFKRKMWPITLGAGFGLGMAYRNCENSLRSHYNIDTNKTISLVESVQKVKLPANELSGDLSIEKQSSVLSPVQSVNETIILDSSLSAEGTHEN